MTADGRSHDFIEAKITDSASTLHLVTAAVLTACAVWLGKALVRGDSVAAPVAAGVFMALVFATLVAFATMAYRLEYDRASGDLSAVALVGRRLIPARDIARMTGLVWFGGGFFGVLHYGRRWALFSTRMDGLSELLGALREDNARLRISGL